MRSRYTFDRPGKRRSEYLPRYGAYAVMSFGGFVGLGHSHYPIPWAALTYDTSLGGFRTNITEQQLKDAPEFSDNSWQDREPATRLAAELGRSPGATVQQACKLKVSLRTRRHTERPAPSGIDAAQAGNP